MTSPDTLLAAIIADPANDDLRLVFADLLDDRGEFYAIFYIQKASNM